MGNKIITFSRSTWNEIIVYLDIIKQFTIQSNNFRSYNLSLYVSLYVYIIKSPVKKKNYNNHTLKKKNIEVAF